MVIIFLAILRPVFFSEPRAERFRLALPRHVWKYIDIQCATAEIRRGKKKKEEEEQTTGQKNIMSASTTQGGHKKCELLEAVVAVMNSRLLDMALQRIT